MGTALHKSAAIADHFYTLLRHCPYPVLVAEAESLQLLCSNLEDPETANGDLESLLDADVCQALRDIAIEPGSTCVLPCEVVPTFSFDGTSAVLQVGCERVDDTMVLILIARPSRRKRDLADPSLRTPVSDPETIEAERALREQEVRFRILADSVPVGIFLTNAEGRVMYANGRWSGITGLSMNQAIRDGWLATVHEQDRSRIEQAWNRFLNGPGPFEEEFRFRANEADVWVAARAVTFTSETGERTGFLGTLIDVTSRKQAEFDLKASEERYRTIFENIMDVYYETSLTGEIVEVSPAIEQVSGYSREELLGRNMLDFYTNVQARGQLLQHLVNGSGALHDYEIELNDRNGNMVACSISCKLEKDQNGDPLKIIGSMRDIRRRKSAEEMLRVERENLELIAKDVPLTTILESIIGSVEQQAPGMMGSILLVDPEGKRLTLGAAPSLPKAYNEAVDGLEIGPDNGCCGRAAHTKARVVSEDIAKDPLWDSYRDIAIAHGLKSCWSHPVFGPGGKVLGTFALYYTEAGKPKRKHQQLIEAASRLAAVAIERRHIEEEQRNLEAQVRQAQKLESLGVLAGGIAHDFNNLLTGIMGYASLASFTLREENSPSLKHVEEIQRVAQRAADLTKQMLAYSGKGKFVTMPLNLSQTVEELAHLLKISISKKARIIYDFSESMRYIEADPAQVQQVVMNLITNASEALNDQPGDITVSTGVLHASRDYLAESYVDDDLPEGEYAYVEVTDTGCGMDPTTQARIFDPFFTTKFTGRGLGMSAVLGIMRGHRGTIKVDSAVGVGTTIRLLFPVLAEGAAAKKDKPWTNAVVTKESWQGDGTILIVDDEEVVRNLAASILAAGGFKVLTAVDGEQGLQVYQSHQADIDAVLLDLTMPNKDGIETFRELRGLDPNACVLLSSGYNEQEVKNRLNGVPVQGFVQKPFTRDRLLEAIQSVLHV